jgi:hypothetical protein
MKVAQNIVIGIALFIFIWFTIEIFNQTEWWGDHIDFDLGSKYGTLIGGIFSFLSVFLIYLTLKHQTNSFEKSAFETRFFQLIEYHRRNIAEWEYRNPKSSKGESILGNKVFISIHREIGEAIQLLKNDLSINSLEQILSKESISKLNSNKTITNRKINLLEFEIINLSYLIVFFGVSKESKPILEKILTERCEKEKIAPILVYFQKIPAVWNEKEYDKRTFQKRIRQNYHYKYFGGHQQRLGHYFRHLYQTVNYCNNSKILKGQYNIKYEYLKTYRAQFSTYEQSVFTYNSISVLGRIWELNQPEKEVNKHLITKFNLIKNIPAEFISEINLTDFYPDVDYEGFPISGKRKALKKSYK